MADLQIGERGRDKGADDWPCEPRLHIAAAGGCGDTWHVAGSVARGGAAGPGDRYLVAGCGEHVRASPDGKQREQAPAFHMIEVARLQESKQKDAGLKPLALHRNGPRARGKMSR